MNEVHIERKAAEAALIASLARSQNALARLLESMADVTEDSSLTAKQLRENAHILTALQETMADAVTCQTWRKRVVCQGQPLRPWFNPEIHHLHELH